MSSGDKQKLKLKKQQQQSQRQQQPNSLLQKKKNLKLQSEYRDCVDSFLRNLRGVPAHRSELTSHVIDRVHGGRSENINRRALNNILREFGNKNNNCASRSSTSASTRLYFDALENPPKGQTGVSPLPAGGRGAHESKKNKTPVSAVLRCVGTATDQQLGGRAYQEDRFSIRTSPGKSSAGDAVTTAAAAAAPAADAIVSAAVFDGHGGSAVSERLACERTGLLGRMVRDASVLPPRPQIDKVVSLFRQFNKTLPRGASAECGATATVAVQRGCSIALYNVGDSRCAIYAARTGRCLACSEDHKAEMPSERQRIAAAGGVVGYDCDDQLLRVGNYLAMSRAFGDKNLESDGLTCEPDVVQYEWSAADGADLVVVLASDGVWDEFSGEEVERLVAKTTRPSSLGVLARKLTERAQRNGADNATSVVLWFTATDLVRA